MKTFILSIIISIIAVSVHAERTKEGAAEFFVKEVLEYSDLPEKDEERTLISIEAVKGTVIYTYDVDFTAILDGYTVKTEEEYEYMYSQFKINMQELQNDTYCDSDLIDHFKLGVNFKSIIIFKNIGKSVVTKNKVITSVDYKSCIDNDFF